jgi:hypothetical protein
MGKPSQFFFLGALILSIVDSLTIVPIYITTQWPTRSTADTFATSGQLLRSIIPRNTTLDWSFHLQSMYTTIHCLPPLNMA